MRRWLRIGGWAVGALVLLGLLFVGGVYGFSSRDFNAKYEVAVGPLPMLEAVDAERLERGAHLATIRGCGDCHGVDGGGQEFANDPAFGLLWASNLTSGQGGIAAKYALEDWDRAVRHGVGADGKPLLFMPSQEFWHISDEDLADIAAYYRSVPAVDRVPPEPRPGPLARLLYLTGKLPLVPAKLVDHNAARPGAPAPAATAEYGAYLATGCTGCHGPGLSGGPIPGGAPGWPEAANLTPDPETGIGRWSLADFTTALRRGTRPDGSALDPAMPVSATKHMTDMELEALYVYLAGLQPRPHGNR